MNQTFQNILAQKLATRTAQGSLRTLKNTTGLIDFVSNDYLGLARSKALHQQIAEKYRQMTEEGICNGSAGSRLLSGSSPHIQALEQQLAQTFKAEKALFFNSGYTANLALLSALPQKGDTIIYDNYIHACLKEGARLSFANRFSFQHNDLDDLELKLQKASGTVFIAIESIYSMDGDISPIRQIVALAKKYHAVVLLDEAHGTGVLGEGGSGLACQLALQQDIFGRVYTFGKAMGVHGACIAGPAVLIDYLTNFARSFIYTTAPSPHAVASVGEAFRYLAGNMHLQTTLQTTIRYFENAFALKPCRYTKVGSGTAIQAILVPGNREVKKLSEKLIHHKFDVRPILSPTVREGEERLRICLHTYNTTEEIDKMLDFINNHTDT